MATYWQAGIGTGSAPALTKEEAERVLNELGVQGMTVESEEDAENGIWLLAVHAGWDILLSRTNGLHLENGGGAHLDIEPAEFVDKSNGNSL